MELQFVINGQVLAIDDLDPETNQAFVQLHLAYFGGHVCEWRDFEAAAQAFFSKTQSEDSSCEKHDTFFSNVARIWRHVLQSGQVDAAELLWRMALRPALDWEEQNRDSFIHKGTPFYFWGMTCILRGDLDRGYALMHRSVEEDCRRWKTDCPDTPGFALATLNYAKVDQAFRAWVVAQAQGLETIIDEYNKLHGRKLSLDRVRGRFLSTPENRDTVFLLVYTLARLSHLQRVPDYALHSDFAGQLEMNLLFDITLVIDAAVKQKNQSKSKFIEHAAFVANREKLGVGEAKLAEVNTECGNDFDKTLERMLKGSFTFGDGSSLSGRALDLATAYAVRNRGAHNVAAVKTVWQNFDDVKQKLFNALFLVVEALY